MYCLDGYNLIFRTLSEGENIREAREELIRLLVDAKIPAILVFDSHFSEEEGRRGHKGELEIVYTDFDESADAYILSALKQMKSPQAVTVVTSDNRLAWRARALKAKTMRAEAFEKILFRRLTKLKGTKEREGPSFPQGSEMSRWLRLFEERLKERD